MAEEMKKEQETAAETQQKEDALKAKYGKIYRVGVILTPDDDTEIAKCYYSVLQAWPAMTVMSRRHPTMPPVPLKRS